MHGTQAIRVMSYVRAWILKEGSIVSSKIDEEIHQDMFGIVKAIISLRLYSLEVIILLDFSQRLYKLLIKRVSIYVTYDQTKRRSTGWR